MRANESVTAASLYLAGAIYIRSPSRLPSTIHERIGITALDLISAMA